MSSADLGLQRQRLLQLLATVLKTLAVEYNATAVVTNSAPSSASLSPASSYAKAGGRGGRSAWRATSASVGNVRANGAAAAHAASEAKDEAETGGLTAAEAEAQAEAEAEVVYGVGWTHAVTTQIALSGPQTSGARDDYGDGAAGAASVVRRATLTKSSEFAKVACEYVIKDTGLEVHVNEHDISHLVESYNSDYYGVDRDGNSLGEYARGSGVGGDLWDGY